MSKRVNKVPKKKELAIPAIEARGEKGSHQRPEQIDEIIISKRLRGTGEIEEREKETTAGIFYLYFVTLSTFL